MKLHWLCALLLFGCTFEEPDTGETTAELATWTATPWTDSLAYNRERLVQRWAAHHGTDVCSAWWSLNEHQKGAFYINTHRLQVARLQPGYDPHQLFALDHVSDLYGIAPGANCGGSGNRIFAQMDWPLFIAMHYAHSEGATSMIDHNWNNAWHRSRDLAGPHDPFNMSTETVYGHPRGQMHFWGHNRGKYDWVCKAGLPNGGCMVDERMFEMDHDFDWQHDSSTECTYDGRTGRRIYEDQHPYIWGVSEGPRYDWMPARCRGANPIDEQRFFVRQHYLDFLDKEPDPAGLEFWAAEILRCNWDAACFGRKRIDVSRAFFWSGEFLAKHPELQHPRGTHAYNKEFVRQAYYRYLRRSCDPEHCDPNGFWWWVSQLDASNPDASDAKYNNLINAFVSSGEYRARFGS